MDTIIINPREVRAAYRRVGEPVPANLLTPMDRLVAWLLSRLGGSARA
jgi:hypothetical protein